MTVWVDSWQLQCCGEPFQIGSQVAWTLKKIDLDWIASLLGADNPVAVDAAEEHHGGVPKTTVPTKAKVTKIAAVHCRYARRRGKPPVMRWVPGTGVLTDITSADGWTDDLGEDRLVGYLVGLKVLPP